MKLLPKLALLCSLALLLNTGTAAKADWARIADGVWVDTSSVYRSPDRQKVNYRAHYGPESDSSQSYLWLGPGYYLNCATRQEYEAGFDEDYPTRVLAETDALYRMLCN